MIPKLSTISIESPFDLSDVFGNNLLVTQKDIQRVFDTIHRNGDEDNLEPWELDIINAYNSIPESASARIFFEDLVKHQYHQLCKRRRNIITGGIIFAIVAIAFCAITRTKRECNETIAMLDVWNDMHTDESF